MHPVQPNPEWFLDPERERPLAVRLGLLKLLSAHESGQGLVLKTGTPPVVPPGRDNGPMDAIQAENTAAGDPEARTHLSDDKLAAEYETARTYVRWLTDAEAWLHRWDYRAFVIGRTLLANLTGAGSA